MAYKVGIPRGLMYYNYPILWETFFKTLGLEVLVSKPTNKLVIDLGSRRVSDEACLPVKVYMGHVAQLCEEELDFLFIPRLVSIEKKAYTCPKIIGLPDMVEASKLKLPALLKPTFNMAAGDKHAAFFKEMALALGYKPGRIQKAWQKASILQQVQDLKRVNCMEQSTRSVKPDELTILLLGHNYNIYDDFLNLNILEKLKNMGCRVILPEEYSKKACLEALQHLPKQLFWTYGRILLGAAYLFSRLPMMMKGVIILTSFGCGIDSFIGNMVMRHLNREGIPLLYLTLDEHTGEAGLVTRIEAFLDMIRWRRNGLSENYFSPHGVYLAGIKNTSGISGPYRYSTSPVQQ